MYQIIDEEKKYNINPAYTLFPDRHCAFIFNSLGWNSFEKNPEVDDHFSQMVSPLFASIFAYWNGGKTYRETFNKIVEELHIQPETLQKFLQPCFHNPERMLLNLSGKTDEEDVCRNWIPKNFIVECSGEKIRSDIPEPDMFAIPKRNWDFNRMRTRIPVNVTLMLTNRCISECIYCYADKTHGDYTPLPTARWLEIIHEAHEIGALSIDLSGGEVFLYPDVETILKTLHQLGYHPYLSTKIPLKEEKIIRLKEAGMTELQLSIDCWDSSLMSRMLQVPETYQEQMGQTLKLLEKHGIKVKVKSVITRYNDRPEQVERLIGHLTSHKNICAISIAPAEYSLYKGEQGFLDFRTNSKQWKEIEATVDKLAELHYDTCEISYQAPQDKNEYCAHVEEKAKRFLTRARCTGNINLLYVLPDGQVTICEELYWNPKFIIGDVRTQSLKKIWESEKATGLYDLSQETIRKTSACSICPQFDICHQKSGVCWKMVIEAYGDKYWDLPDPRCPYAPPATQKNYIE
ncbi:MAG: radical SAM protein [Bacteroidales bacterium]|nr:radical SAM protein [Bacteroidales bacterium]